MKVFLCLLLASALTTFQRCKNSVATVDGEDGRGIGFLCEMDGRRYFATNRHVANRRGPMTALFVDGKKLEFGLDSTVEVADGCDLVRFEIQGELDRPFLKVSNSTPDVGERVEFCGNAKAGNAVTVTSGRILSVGRDSVEIGCPVQSGNRGGPLVRISDGSVIGVTTTPWVDDIAEAASKVGKRQNSTVKQSHEFAARFVGVKWKSVKYGDYQRKMAAFEGIVQFVKKMERLFFSANECWLFEYEAEDVEFPDSPKVSGFLEKIAKSDGEQRKVYDRIVMMEEKNDNLQGGIGRYGDVEIKNAYKAYYDRARNAYRTRREVLERLVSYCKTTKALSEDEREIVVKAFDGLYDRFCDQYRKELKGVFLSSEGEEVRFSSVGQRNAKGHKTQIKSPLKKRR